MINSEHALIAEFALLVENRGEVFRSVDIQHELLPAPHRKPKLPTGKCAVYVFSLAHGTSLEPVAGWNCVLKVGSAGPNSNPRFQSQHYSTQGNGSTLARTLLLATGQWAFVGADKLSGDNVGQWLLQHTDRDHFFLSAANLGLLRELESFVRRRLRPVFEG